MLRTAAMSFSTPLAKGKTIQLGCPTIGLFKPPIELCYILWADHGLKVANGYDGDNHLRDVRFDRRYQNRLDLTR